MIDETVDNRVFCELEDQNPGVARVFGALRERLQKPSPIIESRYARNAVTLTYDLSGIEHARLAFKALEYGDEPHAPQAGRCESKLWNTKYPKIQLLTVAELLDGKKIDMPPVRQVGATFKKAPKASRKGAETGELPLIGDAE